MIFIQIFAYLIYDNYQSPYQIWLSSQSRSEMAGIFYIRTNLMIQDLQYNIFKMKSDEKIESQVRQKSPQQKQPPQMKVPPTQNQQKSTSNQTTQIPQQQQVNRKKKTFNQLFGISQKPKQNQPKLNQGLIAPQQPNRNLTFNRLFGVQQNPKENYSEQIFNDDQPLIQRVKQEQKDAKIQIQIKAQHSMVKLKQQLKLPAMASIKTSGGTRTSVDLICVIDNSGSMSGQKIQLVRDTLKFLTETLTPSDRISLIIFNSFATRLCPLKCVSGENMINLNKIINQIKSGGGTDINSGLTLALKTIKQRKHINSVTSIFLLSDGQDGGAQGRFQQKLKQPESQDLGVYTINSFGFGNNHDEELMTKICNLKDGTFYYIKELATLDQAFCNALGGIISLVANEITIKINNIAKNIIEGVKISKVYGSSWEKINESQYKIYFSQLMSGISKDFVFQLQIPNINTQVGDINRDHPAIEGIFMAKGVNGQNMSGECSLNLTLLNQNEEIPEINENVDVIENYLRVKATEAIEENMLKADLNQYEEAQKGIDNMLDNIRANKKARPQKMVHMIEDLNQIREKCSKNEWATQGRKVTKNAQMAHMQQKNYQYSNPVQKQMVENRKEMKQFLKK